MRSTPIYKRLFKAGVIGAYSTSYFCLFLIFLTTLFPQLLPSGLSTDPIHEWLAHWILIEWVGFSSLLFIISELVGSFTKREKI